MTAQLLAFPNHFRPASPRDGEEPCVILNISSSCGGGRSASARTFAPQRQLANGFAPKLMSQATDPQDFPRECPKVQELRRQSKRLREHFKRQNSGDAK